MEDRPQIINVYIQTVDQHGHKYGPYNNLVSFRRRIQCTLQFISP
jgi:predicted AlkP superfamily pyrophosphatase or phosphodiesterase